MVRRTQIPRCVPIGPSIANSVFSRNEKTGPKATFRLRLPEQLAGKLGVLASHRGIPVETLITQLLAEAVGNKTGRDIESLRRDVSAIASQTRSLESALSIQPIRGLTSEHIRSIAVKLKRYPIDFSESPLSTYYAATADPQWAPSDGGPLEVRMPMPWPTHFSNKPLDQPFNPWRFFDNALRIANHVPAGSKENLSLQRLAHDLVGRLVEYSEVQRNARYVVYRFSREYKGHKVVPPWTSAYGNGAALLGVCRLFERFAEEHFRDIARELFTAFLQFRGSDGHYWISEVDDAGYVWFVEMPLPGDVKQPRVLNGHIRAIQGVFYYARTSGDPEARLLVQAACTTVQRYVREYRRPGQVNRYDLSFPQYPDYGPKRTVEQQHFLAELTGDGFFADTAEMFMTDMFWGPNGRRLDEPVP